MGCSLQPTPQQRGSADQRDDARKNTGQAHAISLLIVRAPSLLFYSSRRLGYSRRS
jgi:hypothetical protein